MSSRTFRNSRTKARPYPQVRAEETIAVYLLSSNDYAATRGRVKHNRFLPNKELKRSVYRVSGLTEPEIWEIGDIHVAEPQHKTALGRGELVAKAISQQGLEIVPETNPHPRHADVIGWPAEKDARLEIAQALARVATLKLKADTK